MFFYNGVMAQQLELLRSTVPAIRFTGRLAGRLQRRLELLCERRPALLSKAQSGSFALAQPEIALLAPVGGEIWVADQTTTIRWQRSLVNDPVRVELNRDYPAGSWTVLASSVSDTFLLWNITGPNTTHARIRILSTVDATLADTCSGDVEIRVPELVLGDFGRSRVLIGFPIELTWTRTAVNGAVNLYLSRDDGGTWPTAIATGLTGDSYEWTPSRSHRSAGARESPERGQSASQQRIGFLRACPAATLYG